MSLIYIWQSAGDPIDPIEFERKDGKFLLRFLRARKFNLDRALQVYINYYKYRHKFAHLLTNFHPKGVSKVLNAGIFGVIEHPLKNGSTAVTITPSRWNYTEVQANDPYRTLLIILEKMLDNEEVQVHGVSLFDNMEGVSWHTAYAFLCCEEIQKGALVEMQDSFPIRFKGFHMFNQPWYLSMVMTVVKPFLSQKNRDRILAHGANYEELHDYLDPSQLPENFGGDAPPILADNLKRYFKDELCNKDCESSSSRTVSIVSGRE